MKYIFYAIDKHKIKYAIIKEPMQYVLGSKFITYFMCL